MNINRSTKACLCILSKGTFIVYQPRRTRFAIHRTAKAISTNHSKRNSYVNDRAKMRSSTNDKRKWAEEKKRIRINPTGTMQRMCTIYSVTHYKQSSAMNRDKTKGKCKLKKETKKNMKLNTKWPRKTRVWFYDWAFFGVSDSITKLQKLRT